MPWRGPPNQAHLQVRHFSIHCQWIIANDDLVGVPLNHTEMSCISFLSIARPSPNAFKRWWTPDTSSPRIGLKESSASSKWVKLAENLEKCPYEFSSACCLFDGVKILQATSSWHWTKTRRIAVRSDSGQNQSSNSEPSGQWEIIPQTGSMPDMCHTVVFGYDEVRTNVWIEDIFPLKWIRKH